MNNMPAGDWTPKREEYELECEYCGEMYTVEGTEELGSVDFDDDDYCPQCGYTRDEQRKQARLRGPEDDEPDKAPWD